MIYNNCARRLLRLCAFLPQGDVSAYEYLFGSAVRSEQNENSRSRFFRGLSLIEKSLMNVLYPLLISRD